MHLIGINGFKQSGKGTLASIIHDEAAGVVYEVGFADKLKVYAARSLGYLDLSPRECIELMDEFKLEGSIEVWLAKVGPPHADLDFSGRQYLQNVGNEARKLFGEHFWVDQVLPRPSSHPSVTNRDSDNHLRLEAHYPDVDVVAITDLRYENEAVRVKQLGGIVVEVTRPGVASDGHASEQPLPDALVDYSITNDGTIEELRFEALDLLVSLGVAL